MAITYRDNVCFSVAGLGEDAGTAGAYNIVNAVDFTIGGRTYNRAAGTTDDLVISAGTSLAAKQQCVFWVWLNSSGTASTTQSSIVSTASNTTTPFVDGAWDWPHRDGYCCIGAIRVKTEGSAVFVTTGTAGTSTDLGAASVTDTYYNVVGDYSTPVPYDSSAP